MNTDYNSSKRRGVHAISANQLNPSRWHPFARFTALLRGREAAHHGKLTLNRSRIFIIPNRYGITFATTLLAMMIGAINYNNSLAYLLTFLLAGVGMVAMVHTFRNLNRLQLQLDPAVAVFVGETMQFPLRIHNPTAYPRHAVQLLLNAKEIQRIDIDPFAEQRLTISLQVTKRGQQQAPRFTLRSHFPLGIFSAWSPCHLAATAIAYPAPAATTPFPDQRSHGSHSEANSTQSTHANSGNHEFFALRNYNAGDSLRHVHWHAFARGQALMVKQFAGQSSQRLWFDWDQLANLDPEARLSLLCRWVLDAERAGLSYGVKLPQITIPPASGHQQQQQALTALALF
ncbi:MAG: DUF58 domain-containing protein [Gammaproteobacteria bacterium]|nr:DUF58 domain-containing protein [Gammaproteobacteria bacterium]